MKRSEKQRNRETEKQRDRETERRRDRETERRQREKGNMYNERKKLNKL